MVFLILFPRGFSQISPPVLTHYGFLVGQKGTASSGNETIIDFA